MHRRKIPKSFKCELKIATNVHINSNNTKCCVPRDSLLACFVLAIYAGNLYTKALFRSATQGT